MLKQIFIGLKMVADALNPMEPIHQELVIMPTPEQKICYLSQLPIDVLDYIAQFLTFNDWESEEEFIERTCIPKKVPFKYYGRCIGQHEEVEEKDIVFCPDETKFAILPGPYNYPHKTFKVFNLITVGNSKGVQRAHCEQLHEWVGPSCIAISSSNMYAYVDEKRKYMAYADPTIVVKDLLIIKRYFYKSKAEIALPDSFCKIASVAFNKQGTHVIVHGSTIERIDESKRIDRQFPILGKLCDKLSIDYFSKQKVPGYAIYALKENAEQVVKRPKTLSEYFMRYGICKKL